MKRFFPVFLPFLLVLLAVTEAVAGNPPSSFDLRDVNGRNYVTSVKNQSGGTCWTHGVMAAMEGNLLMTGNWATAGETGEPDLAEYHLDWWNGFNKHNNDDIDPPTGSGLTVHMGGDYLVAAAYLTRGEGAVRDEDGQSYGSPPLRSDPSYHYFYARDIEWYTAGSGLGDIDTIKNHIMQYGVMGTCMCYNSKFMNSSYVHYQPPSSTLEPNHAVAIIGWDDDKQTQAPQRGAWLCKNSWGASWGYGGFFWISYYDKWCGQHPEMGAVSFQDVEPMPYDNIHYHDYHGWRDTMTGVTEAFNSFTALAQPATGRERLAAVSFFTAAADVSFTVKVFDDFDGAGLSNQLVAKSGVIAYRGFHTIDLDTPVWLDPGDDFYVYLSLSAGGQPYDRTSEVPVLLGASYRVVVESSANPGESYYRSGGAWRDLFDFNDTANFCIKALTVEEPALKFSFPQGLPGEFVPPGPETPVTVKIASGYENYVPGSGLLHYRFGPGDPYDTLPLAAVGGDLYEAEIPAARPGDAPEYFFSAEGDGGTLCTSPFTAPAEVYSFTICLLEPFFEDDFEKDRGWTVSSVDLQSGEWERGVPAGGGLRGDPPADADGSGSCFVTENAPGDTDVDGGPTRLTSPLFDLSAADDALITYWRWHYNDTGDDELISYLSNNGGALWIPVEWADNTNGWKEYSFKVSHLMGCTARMRMRFRAEDNPDDSITEEGVDAFSVKGMYYHPSLWAGAYSFSAAAGCFIPLVLEAGSAYAGRDYAVAGGVSGSYPGTPLPGGARLPVNWDGLTDYILGHPASPFFPGFQGTLDPGGGASAGLDLPPAAASAFAGRTLTFAFALTGTFDFVSNPLSIEIEP